MLFSLKKAVPLLVLGCGARAHGPHMPEALINPALGVPGFPDCKRKHPEVPMTVAEAAMDLFCAQREAGAEAIKIGCVGDSITAGVHSSGGNHPYPQQLQILLDHKYGQGKFSVTNLGACGSTMLKNGDSPYWQRPQFTALKNGTWDLVTIMLGTNDAKDPGDQGPNNWQHNCGGKDHTSLANCTFAQDYASMISLVRTLGTTPEKSPKIFAMIPPPLMQLDSIGANQTVINSVFPELVPMIATANKVGLVDIYTGMGGEQDWATDPNWPSSCVLNSPWKPCSWWCDAQSCDQCHPNDNGYTHLATVLQPAIGL